MFPLPDSNKKLLSDDIKDISLPGVRISVRMLIIAVIALSSVVILLWKTTASDKKDQLAEAQQIAIQIHQDCTTLKREDSTIIVTLQMMIQKIQSQKDSLTDEVYQLSILRIKDKSETINKIKGLINGQKSILEK